MALTAVQLQAQIDAIIEQMGAPERQVTNGTESVTYRTMADLQGALNTLQGQLALVNAAAAGTTRHKVQYLTYGGRGFNGPRDF